VLYIRYSLSSFSCGYDACDSCIGRVCSVCAPCIFPSDLVSDSGVVMGSFGEWLRPRVTSWWRYCRPRLAVQANLHPPQQSPLRYNCCCAVEVKADLNEMLPLLLLQLQLHLLVVDGFQCASTVDGRGVYVQQEQFLERDDCK
jgi:hypothetical protein